MKSQEASQSISRIGTIKIHDATLSVWEDEVDETGLAAVFDDLIRLLRSRGWTVHRDKRIVQRFRILRKHHRYCHKDRLEAKLSYTGRHLEFNIFQNVANVEHPSGGEYDYNRLARMPYLLRKRAQLALRHVTRFLNDKHGYTVEPQKPVLGIDGHTALDWVQWQIENCWHYKPDLGHADWHYDANRTTADRQLLTHGCPVFYCDRKGRWCKGTAYYNLNNMWWVVSGRDAVTNLASFELYLSPPANPRVKNNAALREKRLKKLMHEASGKLDFIRAQTLKEALYGKEARKAA